MNELSSSTSSSSFDSAQSITFVRADIRDITAATINVGGNNGGEIPRIKSWRELGKGTFNWNSLCHRVKIDFRGPIPRSNGNKRISVYRWSKFHTLLFHLFRLFPGLNNALKPGFEFFKQILDQLKCCILKIRIIRSPSFIDRLISTISRC